MTTVAKSAPSFGSLPHAARKFRRETRLLICGALVCGLLACPGALSAPAPAADGGTITGTVLDELSHPVPHAMVYAEPAGSHVPPMGMILPEAEADANGRFVMRRVRWGTYAVEADKTGAGYPPVIAFGSFYGRRQFPRVTLSQQAPAATVVVRIGPKAGVLSGTIVNARTGEPITRARIDFKRMGHTRTQTSEAVRAHFTLLIPSEMPITLTVHARGFQPWPETVKIAPGERKVLTIHLRPLAPEPGTP